MAMVRNLPHNAIYHELPFAIFGAGDCRKRVHHQRALGLCRGGPMFAEDRHRSIAGVAIEDGEGYGMTKAGVVLCVLT